MKFVVIKASNGTKLSIVHEELTYDVYPKKNNTNLLDAINNFEEIKAVHGRTRAAMGGRWRPRAAAGGHERPRAATGHGRPRAATGGHDRPRATM